MDVKASVSCVADREMSPVYAGSWVAALNSPLSARGLTLLDVKLASVFSISAEDTQHHSNVGAIVMRKRRRLSLLADTGVT